MEREREGQGSTLREGEGQGITLSEGEGQGSTMREGEGQGITTREGEGQGSTMREGEGQGSTMREGEGQGSTLTGYLVYSDYSGLLTLSVAPPYPALHCPAHSRTPESPGHLTTLPPTAPPLTAPPTAAALTPESPGCLLEELWLVLVLQHAEQGVAVGHHQPLDLLRLAGDLLHQLLPHQTDAIGADQLSQRHQLWRETGQEGMLWPQSYGGEGEGCHNNTILLATPLLQPTLSATVASTHTHTLQKTHPPTLPLSACVHGLRLRWLTLATHPLQDGRLSSPLMSLYSSALKGLVDRDMKVLRQGLYRMLPWLVRRSITFTYLQSCDRHVTIM